jgi:hypothetical protein
MGSSMARASGAEAAASGTASAAAAGRSRSQDHNHNRAGAEGGHAGTNPGFSAGGAAAHMQCAKATERAYFH